MNILIIEDDEVWQQQLHLMLDELPDSQIYFSTDLTDARVKLEAYPPHLVIADVVLPDGLSFELFQRPDRTYPIRPLS